MARLMAGVEIPPERVYEQLLELTREVQAQSGQLDRLCDAQKVTSTQLAKLDNTVGARLTGYAARLRAVEGRLLYASGAAVALGGGGGYALSLLLP